MSAEHFLDRFWKGYYFAPWKPYSASRALRIRRGICNMLNLHRPARDGSWCFGASICGLCGMDYNIWSEERREQAAGAINRLPEDERQQAAARISGGGP